MGGANAELTYQWQRRTSVGGEFYDLPDETSSSLTVTDVQLNMSGWRYRVVVTNSYEVSRESGAAELTVRPRRVTFTVIYDGNGHTHGTAPTPRQVTTTGTFTLSEPGNMQKEGYTFAGWMCPSPGIFIENPWQIHYPNVPIHWTSQMTGTWTVTAVWIRTTRNYNILANTTTPLIDVHRIMHPVERAFLINFGIHLVANGSGSQTTALNPRTTPTNCTRIHPPNDYCNATCGSDVNCHLYHHRSARHFLFQNQVQNTFTFRFVDFQLCHWAGSRGHIFVGGLAVSNGHDMIVSTWSSNQLNLTSHEISHLFGAPDDSLASPCILDQDCVMRGHGEPYNQWCDRCAAIIMSNR